MLRLRWPLAALTLLFLGLFLASLVPVPRAQIENEDVPLPDLGYAATVGLDYPTQLRLGTTDSLYLTTRLDAATGVVQTLPPDTAIVVHMDSDCLTFDPPGDTAQALLLTEDQLWAWQLEPLTDSDDCDLTLVIRLRQPETLDEEVIYIRKLTFQTTSLLGLPPLTLRTLGLIGSILSLLALAFIQFRAPKQP